MTTLYESFLLTSRANSNKLALNHFTFDELLSKVESEPYNLIAQHDDYRIIIDILVASKHNRPLVILPMDKKDYFIPSKIHDSFGLYLYTSGSTSGVRKPIFLSESMLLQNANNAISCQNITNNDVIFTVCSMHHTGGINVQLLPSLLIGCTNIVEDFNAFTFNRRLEETKATVTHLVPRMLNQLRTVSKNNLRLVAAGSDCITKEHISKWLDVGVDFMVNYGLTEAGPVIINHTFKDLSELEIFDNGVPLGDNISCEYKIDDNELFLNGREVTIDGWLQTGDCMYIKDNWFFYRGRKSAGCKFVPKRY